MGVYIKDMEMPSGCASCDFANYLRDGEPYCRRLMRRVPAARRLPDCPIGPVPPHGRLGDLDELKERATKRLYASNHGSMAEAYYAALIDLIDSAPVIILGEGESGG